jgi:Ni/Co efflux regulator RcnB
MNKKIIVAALLAAAFGSAIPVSAQERSYGNDGNWQQRSDERDGSWRQRTDEPDASRQHRDEIERRWEAQRRYDRRVYRDERGDRSRGGWGRTSDYNAGYDGAGPYHNLRRGERLPSRYRSHQYVVNDWHGHHLKAPPRGYHWVQTGADYVLVGIATGLIADMILSQ